MLTAEISIFTSTE